MSLDQIPLAHHVYTSTGGYTTVFASPEIAESTIEKLEVLAALYCQSQKRLVQSSYFNIDNYHCVLTVRPLGTDHTNRPRVCAHTTLVSQRDVVRTAGLNVLMCREEMFASDWSDLESLISSLAPKIEASKLILNQFFPFFADYKAPATSITRAVLAGYLFGSRNTLVIGPLPESEKLVKCLGLLVPRLTRANTAIYFNHKFKPVDDDSVSRFYLVDSEDEIEPTADFTVIDLTLGHAKNTQSTNGHPHIDFMVELLERKHLRRQLSNILVFQESDPCFVNRNIEQYFNYVKALQILEPYLAQNGKFIGLEGLISHRAHLRSLMSGIIYSYRSGSRNSALALFKTCLDCLCRISTRQQAKRQLEDEFTVWSEALTAEEFDTFMRTMGMVLEDSGQFPVVGFE